MEKRLEKKEEHNKKVEELEQRMESIERKMESTQAGNWEGIRETVSGMEREIERKERWERRDNLTIRGLNAEEGKEKASVEELLKKDLRTGGRIKKVRRQGTREKGVIIVEMETWEEKQEVMRNKNRLGARKVYVDHDLTYNTVWCC